ncbi:hypothetical protein K8R30_01855 [archaeon]|nr:hypothetical protein [archaeon]
MLEDFFNTLSAETNIFLTLSFFTAVIVIYSVFVFFFYRFLAKKNIIEFNLNQYNQYSSQFLVKVFAVVFYVVEYVVLLPVLTFFWFAILSILILLLAKDMNIATVLLVSAALVTSSRVASYLNEDLAKDLAKMLPFTLLVIAITTTGFFDISALFSRIGEIPSLFSKIPYYLLFIVAIELIMRAVDFVHSLVQSTKATEEEPEVESTE